MTLAAGELPLATPACWAAIWRSLSLSKAVASFSVCWLSASSNQACAVCCCKRARIVALLASVLLASARRVSALRWRLVLLT
ncbi:hypothetical protein D3C80_1786240 [compost metagenome]